MKKDAYPKPWQPTGCGSYREIRKGVFLLNWRPFGAKGPRRNKTVTCTEAEAIAFIAQQSVNRSREALSMPVTLTWADARKLYVHRLEAKGVTPKYKADVLKLIDELISKTHSQDVSQVHSHHIESWMDGRVRTAKKKCERRANKTGWARTANKELKMIGAFFKWLARHRRIDRDPTLALDNYRETKQPPRELTPEEYAAVWKASEPTIRDLLDFFLITSARFGEIRNLRRENITPAHIWTAKNRKGKDFNRLHLPPELVEIIKRQPAADDGYVFHRWVSRMPGATPGHGFKRGERIGVEWWNDVLEARCKTAGIPVFKGHDLRHAAATWAKKNGCSPWYIQALLGHADLKTTLMYADGQALEGTKVVQKTLLDLRTKAIQRLAT